MTTYYTKDHEWVRPEGEEAFVGISHHAAQQLGDVVFVESPQTGTSFKKGDEVAVVESVKAASEVYAPLDGEITAVNEELADNPNTVNEDPEGRGWFFKIKLNTLKDLESLMSSEDYTRYLETLE